MHTFFYLLIFSAVSISAQAAKFYTCTNHNGNIAELSIRNYKNINWSEPWHEANSRGKYIRNQTTSDSDLNDYHHYELKDFFNTDSASYFLALSNISEPTLTAVTYTETENQTKDKTTYNCTKQNAPPNN